MKSNTQISIFSSSFSITRVLLGVALIFICAQTHIPLKFVPITLHSAGVLIIALLYQRREAMATIISYVTLGAIGAPMYSGLAGGWEKFSGTTGGYLIGMIACTYIVTSMRAKFGEDSFAKLFAYSILGSSTIFLFGIPWLASIIGFTKAIEFGLVPFILPGIVKALFVGSTVRLFKTKMPWQSK